jgi:hypothetical protein
MCPAFVRRWKMPGMVIGLSFNNQACFFDVSRNWVGEELLKYYLVKTLPSSAPIRTHGTAHKADVFCLCQSLILFLAGNPRARHSRPGLFSYGPSRGLLSIISQLPVPDFLISPVFAFSGLSDWEPMHPTRL